MLRKHQIVKLENFRKEFKKSEAKKLFGFAAMTITTAATVPVSHMIVRSYIGETLSWDHAGYWQAIWYISAMYLMVVTTTLSIYYLPRLSEIKDKRELMHEVKHGYKIILPTAIFTSALIYLIKDYIILLLFDENFTPIRELFLWQLVGDVVKIACFLLGYVVIAKAMVKVFIVKEIVISFCFVILSVMIVDKSGLVGVTYSYFLTYIINLVVLSVIYRRYIRR
jgi:PST family polysaccharide transporter